MATGRPFHRCCSHLSACPDPYPEPSPSPPPAQLALTALPCRFLVDHGLTEHNTVPLTAILAYPSKKFKTNFHPLKK